MHCPFLVLPLLLSNLINVVAYLEIGFICEVSWSLLVYTFSAERDSSPCRQVTYRFYKKYFKISQYLIVNVILMEKKVLLEKRNLHTCIFLTFWWWNVAIFKSVLKMKYFVSRLACIIRRIVLILFPSI